VVRGSKHDGDATIKSTVRDGAAIEPIAETTGSVHSLPAELPTEPENRKASHGLRHARETVPKLGRNVPKNERKAPESDLWGL